MSYTVLYISKEISDVMNLRCASQFVTETKEKCILILVLIIMTGGCTFSFFGLDRIGKTGYQSKECQILNVTDAMNLRCAFVRVIEYLFPLHTEASHTKIKNY